MADTNPLKPAIEVKDLGFSYGDKAVFRHLNFNIYPNEFIGLIGGNGAGKSTLVKLILGLETPTEGSIIRFGQKNWDRKQRSNIGYISQKAASFNSAFPGTVEEIVMANLCCQIGLFRRPRKIHYEMVHNALSLVGMEDYKHKLIGNLSGGQQQRVFLARVLVNEPKLIFLDEPTVGIDIKSEGEIYQLLHTLNKESGVGIVLVSHDIGAVTVHATRLLCLGANGFFQHESRQKLESDFLNKLYGYSVLAHSHINPMWQGMNGVNMTDCELCNHHHHLPESNHHHNQANTTGGTK